MTRRHFQALAESFKQISDLAARREVAQAVVRASHLLNPNFNEARFMAACGL